jgi:hypothetical protein
MMLHILLIFWSDEDKGSIAANAAEKIKKTFHCGTAMLASTKKSVMLSMCPLSSAAEDVHWPTEGEAY